MFRFTIRDVLWLTVVLVLGAGWWLDRRSLAKDNQRLDYERLVWRLVADSVAGDFKVKTGIPQSWTVLGKSWPNDAEDIPRPTEAVERHVTQFEIELLEQQSTPPPP